MNRLNYENFLKKNVFNINEYFQFKLLFDDIKRINKIKFNHAVILERSYMYGNRSIFMPLFDKNKKISSINFKIKEVKYRQGIQNSFLNNFKGNLPKSEFWIKDNEKNFTSNISKIDTDFLIIPNSLHHISNFDSLMNILKIKMPKLKQIYIFDSYLRESHQNPNDYARHTVNSLKILMKNFKFKAQTIKETGNVFDGILYLFSQSSELLKNKNLEHIKDTFEKKLKESLINERHKKKWHSLGRKYATMSTAYSVLFKK
jgi:hypothetical protein